MPRCIRSADSECSEEVGIAPFLAGTIQRKGSVDWRIIDRDIPTLSSILVKAPFPFQYVSFQLVVVGKIVELQGKADLVLGRMPEERIKENVEKIQRTLLDRENIWIRQHEI